MYFVNHRSWADFFVDGLEVRIRIKFRDMIPNSSYLSRMAVIFAFPTACLCGYLNQFIWFFKRQRGISRDWFTSFFKKNWAVRFFCILYSNFVEIILVLLFILKDTATNEKEHCL